MTKHHQGRHCHARVCVQPHHVINSVNLRGRDRAFGDSPIHHVSCLIGLGEQIRPVHGQLISQRRYRLTTSRSLFGSEQRSVARTVGSHSYHDLEAIVGTAGRVSWLTSIIIACL